MKKVIKQYTAARTAIGGREPTPPDQPADWATLPFTCRSLGRAAFSDTRRKMTAGLIQTAHSTGRQLVLRRSESLVSNSRRVAKLRLRLCRTYAGSGFGPSLVQEDDRTVLVAAVRASLKSTFLCMCVTSVPFAGDPYFVLGATMKRRSSLSLRSTSGRGCG